MKNSILFVVRHTFQKCQRLLRSQTLFAVLSLISVALLLIQCGTLNRPRYSTANYQSQSERAEMATPNEIYSSNEVLKNQSQTRRSDQFRLQWPVRRLKINRGFIPDDHMGLDIAGRMGDSILAAHDGVVVYAGSGFKGYGRMIILEYNSEWATLYGHLNRIRVKTGQTVKAGSLIGTMGRSGRATGVHLHFELMRNKQPIDPEAEFAHTHKVVFFKLPALNFTDGLRRWGDVGRGLL